MPQFAVDESPSLGDCLTFPETFVTYEYPQDFETYGGVLNEMAHYVCPASGVRVLQSNSIPDHAIVQVNANVPCAQHQYVELPLRPVRDDAFGPTEVPPFGMIGVATNGVHLFGAQEAGQGNALDANGAFGDARFWYGHATAGKVAHYHNPRAGHDPDVTPSEDELLGWALDGYGIYGFTDAALDECNGRYVGDDGDGEYRYHVRFPVGWSPEDCWDGDVPPEYCSDVAGATNWNYIVGCYWGDVTSTKIGDNATYVRPDDCVLASDDYDDGATPTSSCADLETFDQKEGLATGTPRTCRWVLEGTGGRCADYADECPVSCDVCADSEVCEDSETWAYTDGARDRGCRWVAQDPAVRCDYIGSNGVVAWQFGFQACLVACGECP